MAAGLPDDFQRHFLVTHFFNPVRYMKLLEIVPGRATDPDVVEAARRFGTEWLGKGVVLCKDTPNFIANRVGVYGSMIALRRALAEGYRFDEVDTIMGEPMGRPRSAIFRTCDIAGLDVLLHVARNVYDNAPDDECRDVFAPPPLLQELVARGWLGEKSGQGFYKRIKGAEGSEILVLDHATMEYRPREKWRFDSIGEVKDDPDPAARIRGIVSADDRAARFARPLMRDLLTYSARRVPEIADSPQDVDDAMRWGFNWVLGPFQTWDALGVANVAVALLEYHSKLNAIDQEIVTLTREALERGARAFRALVIGNDAADFSVGANLALLLMGARMRQWAQLERVVKAFQDVNMAIKYSPVPVVAAAAGRTLGGGCEVLLHGARARAAAELYCGLVETGVGLVPAGGGCKELLLRAREVEPAKGPFPPVRRAFETIAYATV